MNNEKIKIAIIMPAYNCEDTIKKSILSVINQTYTNWHLYIINDCSVDNTSIILEDYFLNDKITIIENGAAGSRNRGITLSTEPVIAFIDSDDLWNENKLLLQVEEIAKGEKFIITDYDYIEQSTQRTFSVSWGKKYLTEKDFLKKKFRVCFSSLLYIRCENQFKKIGHEDFVFLFELFKLYGDAKVINKNLVSYISVENSLSSNKKKAIIWHVNCLKYIFNDNYLKVFYYFLYYMVNGILFKRKNR